MVSLAYHAFRHYSILLRTGKTYLDSDKFHVLKRSAKKILMKNFLTATILLACLATVTDLPCRSSFFFSPVYRFCFRFRGVTNAIRVNGEDYPPRD